MSILDRLREKINEAEKQPAKGPEFFEGKFRYSGAPVGDSRDLRRVLELPRRPQPTPAELDALVDGYTRALRKPTAPCNCQAKFNRPCVLRLKPAQAQALYEISDPTYRAGKPVGLFAPIAVGGGKTLLDLLAPMVAPECKRAVLFIPPNLRAQLLTIDWEFYGNHWRLPNLAGGSVFTKGRPVLTVVSYSELSNAKSTDLLDKLKPDLIVSDEGHNLRNRTAARTKRFLRYFHANPTTRFVVWSGTLTSKSIRDYAHLIELSLGEGSPLPKYYPTVEEWAGALDPSDWPGDPGALRRLCEPGEDVRAGFRRRLLDTKGVVATNATDGCAATLLIAKRDPPTTPLAVTEAIKGVAARWTRPDGEELVDALSVSACVQQLSAGFYYRWIYPRGEEPDLITRWFKARQEWNRELRERLKHPQVHMDSPLLCTKAAIRFHAGYKGPLPVWRSDTWPSWYAIHKAVQPESQTVWIDAWLASDAAQWAAENVGVVWYKFGAFGKKVAELGKLTRFGGGDEASASILQETGTRSIVASIAAHGTGKNLQHAFSRNLIGNVPSDGKTFEQLIGRTHRTGQAADEVTCDVYLHTPELKDAFSKARSEARYVEDTFGTPQKLNMATLSGI